MASNEASLAVSYDLIKHRVISSTQIASRTSAIVSKFSQPATEGQKPAIVCMTAEARVATKLVSVVEIAKRELASKGVPCFQYNALSSRVVDVPREPKKKHDADKPKADKADEEDAFQTMADPMGATKKRSVPSMTIYMSSVPVKELRAAYGEQR